MPSSRPPASRTGPPEEPGSSCAVCSRLPVMRRPRGPRNARSTPETNPNVTRNPRPPGLDRANTGVPIAADAPSAHGSAGAPPVSTSMTARSPPVDAALARIGHGWALLVDEALPGGPQRFNDLLGQTPGIAANILPEPLKRLEREGLLIARSYSERPPGAAYQLTAEGTEL